MSEMVQENKKKSGCSYQLIFGMALVWVLAVTFMGQLMNWVMEQAIFEGSFNFPDLRWLIGFAYAALTVLPLFMLVFILSDPMLKRIFRFWGMIGALGFLLTPVKLVKMTNMITVGILQGVLILVLILIYWVYFKIKNKKFVFNLRTTQKPVFLAFMILCVLTIPWVLWGALGAVSDIIVNTLVSILASVLFTTVFFNNFPLDDPELTNLKDKILFTGLILFGGLLIFSTVLGQSGQQLILVFTLPFAAWVLARFVLNYPSGQFPSLVFLAGLISTLLLWVDSDEMSLIVTAGSGELISWVNRMIFVTIFILLIITAISGLLIRRVQLNKIGLLWGIIPLMWIILGFVYFQFGQPGLFGEKLFVILKDQSDLSEVSNDWDFLQKREYVYDQMTNFASQSQMGLRASLDQFGIEYTPYYLVNAIEVNGGPILRLYLESRDDVDRVLDDPYLRPLAEELPISEGDLGKPMETLWNLEMIGADQVWSEFGITGEGVIIGQSDSGVDYSHPELIDSYAGIEGNGDYTWFDPWFNSRTPQDFGGHGTHTMGTMVGKNTGVAPGASWIGCVNLARNLGNPAYYLDCMQFMLAPFPVDGDPFTDGDPARGANVLNNSWGCPEIEGCDPDVFSTAVSSLRKAGVFVVASAGNSGYSGCGSVSDPLAIYDDVLSVGSIDEQGFLSMFSSLGPVEVDGSNRIKPDLVAPGDLILSSLPNGTYGELSGTSMAGPHVVGVVALMWSANPALMGNVDLTEEILFETASPFEGVYPTCIGTVTSPNNAVGYGVVNAKRAVEAAKEIK